MELPLCLCSMWGGWMRWGWGCLPICLLLARKRQEWQSDLEASHCGPGPPSPSQAPAGRSLLNHSSRKDSAGLQALNPAISSSLSHVICLLPECLISRLYLGSAGLTMLASTAFYACLLAMLLLAWVLFCF